MTASALVIEVVAKTEGAANSVAGSTRIESCSGLKVPGMERLAKDALRAAQTLV